MMSNRGRDIERAVHGHKSGEKLRCRIDQRMTPEKSSKDKSSSLSLVHPDGGVMADDRAPQMPWAHCEKQSTLQSGCGIRVRRSISPEGLAIEAEHLWRNALSMIGQMEGWLQEFKPQRCTAAFVVGC